MFNKSQFISDNVTFREESMFLADIEANSDRLSVEIKVLEFGLGVLIVRMKIRVILLGHLAERGLYIVLARRFLNAEDLVIISFFCHVALLAQAGAAGRGTRLRGLFIGRSCP